MNEADANFQLRYRQSQHHHRYTLITALSDGTRKFYMFQCLEILCPGPNANYLIEADEFWGV